MDWHTETKKYIAYVKSHPCVVCGKIPVDPDHLEAIGLGGNRKKPTLKDFSCVPLCRIHHTERHSIGIGAFEVYYKVNLWKEAFKILRRWHTDEHN